MDNIKAIQVLLSFVLNMIKDKKYLNDDFYNNYAVCHQLCQKVVKKSDTHFIVEGIKNIPIDGSILIAPNHVSFFDIILLMSIIDRPIAFAAALELYSYPVLNTYMEAINCVSIDRNTTDYKEIKKQLNNINCAISENGLIVFPEGECSYNQDVSEFKKGAFMNLKKGTTRIIPTYISTPSMIKIGRWTVPKDNVLVAFGTPFKVEDEFEYKPKAEEIAKLTRNKVLQLKNKFDD